MQLLIDQLDFSIITEIGIMQVMILVHNRCINCNSFDC
jgi:hypothetical protein